MDRLVEPAPAAVTAPPEEHKFKGQAWIRSAPPSNELFAFPATDMLPPASASCSWLTST